MQGGKRTRQQRQPAGETKDSWGAGYVEIVKKNALFEKYYQVRLCWWIYKNQVTLLAI